jgi:hypothetical protein
VARRLTVLSFVFWTLFVLLRPNQHPYADLSRGKFTDHFSHMNTTRLFPRVGLDLYRVPIRDHGHKLTLKEIFALPHDIPARPHNCEVFGVDGWPPDKPLMASWTHRPRMHPPGDLILLAPAAIAYSFTSLSFSGVNKLIIILFLLYAHAALYFVFDGAFTAHSGFKIGVIATAIIYSEVIHWTLEGFYEAAVIAPLILCARFVVAKKNLYAIVMFCAAVFIHFRALFFAPWVVLAAVMIVRNKEWTAWTKREWAIVPLAIFLGGSALGVYAILWPILRDLPLENAVLNIHAPVPLKLASFGCILICAAGALIYFRAWLDLAVLAWMSMVLVTLREAYEWNLLSMLAWLGAPPLNVKGEHANYVQITRIAFLVFVANVALREIVFPTWLLQVVQR